MEDSIKNATKKWGSQNLDWRSGLGSLAGFCDQGFMEGGEFLDQQSDCQLLVSLLHLALQTLYLNVGMIVEGNYTCEIVGIFDFMGTCFLCVLFFCNEGFN